MASQRTIWVVDLEPIPTRYTKEWRYHLPEILATKTGCDIRLISGSTSTGTTTPGAFLDFFGTNVYKSEQAIKLVDCLKNEVQKNDSILFTDAWNPVVLMARYMVELNHIPVTLHGIWHSGSYDEHDILGRMPRIDWARTTELALLQALDKNYFATNFHLNLIKTIIPKASRANLIRTGFPMEYIQSTWVVDQLKENLVVFPHRISPEKQPDLFRALAKELPQYEFVMCQEQNMDKKQYHDTLTKAKIVFSANLQETLGIGVYEGMVHGAIPLVPDRLSYTEMYNPRFRYPSSSSIPEIKEILKSMMENYSNIDRAMLLSNITELRESFFSCDIMASHL